MIPIAKPYLTQDDAKAAYDTVLSGWVTQGPKVQEFEETFARYTGAKYAVAVSSCTAALHLAMIVAGIVEGDEIICPSMSYIATANSIKHAGAIPVFAEVNSDYNLDISDVEHRITTKTKAILIVHQMGMPADIDSFKTLCDNYNLILIEDAACAIGSVYKEKRIGTHSDLVCFSFHPRKVITTGDGGMITTSNEAFYYRLKALRQHGMNINDRERHLSSKILFEEHVEVGYNYRMTDIQAAIGIMQMEKLDWLVEERRKIAYQYLTAFKDVHAFRLPIEPEGYFTNYQSFSIYLTASCPISRNEFMEKLLLRGISTRRGIMLAHREKAYTNLMYHCQLPKSEDLNEKSVLLPLFVPMEPQDVIIIIQGIYNIIGVPA